MCKKTRYNIFSLKKEVSNLQMTLTLILVLSLVLSNILVVKPINLFGVKQLGNTCAVFVFPITYILSDVFSEVYGYKWSRLTAMWAMLGNLSCSLLLALMVSVQGSENWLYQKELIHVLGSTPLILVASLLAFWLGDYINDLVYEKLKLKKFKGNGVCLRAILSSLIGEYVDVTIFTFIGLYFLPLSAKVIMIINTPLIQICLEVLFLPITKLIINKIKKLENIQQ